MKMNKMAICDDEPYSLEMLEYNLKILREEGCIQAEIDVYRSGEELLRAGEKYEILILDIEMPKINGLKTAEQYRKMYEDAIIIFLTGHEDYVFDGYKVSAFRYLKKPIDIEKLREALQSAVEKLGDEYEIEIWDEGGMHIVRQRDIIYVETNGRNIIVRTMEKDYSVKMGINQFARLLQGTDFISPHKSYYVNLRYVKEFNKEEAILSNGEKVKISCKKYAQFRNTYREYRKN